MVKENTHLFLAMQIKNLLPKSISFIIQNNLNYYLAGAILPDIFYYNKDLAFISNKLHGESSSKSNKLILEFIKSKNLDDRDLAFLFGYLTHYSADIIFHPIIYYLTGNYYDKNLKKAQTAIYNHRLLETQIDTKLNKDFFVSKLIKKETLNDCYFFNFIEKKFNINSKLKKKLFSTFIINNKFFKSNIIYNFAKYFTKIGLFKKINLAFFYLELKKNSFKLNWNNIQVKNLFSGKKELTSLELLTNNSIKYSQKQIINLFNYYKNKISLEEFEKVYEGKSLDTGTFFRTSKIKYYFNTKNKEKK